jgi:aldose 1-epimerase
MTKFFSPCEPFGILPTGEAISQYHIKNNLGTTVKLMNYGAALTSFTLPGAAGKPVEITLGFDTLQAYLSHPYYFGCTVGRVANRIAHGKFDYEGKTFQLICNENPVSHLHGGAQGFDKIIWDANIVETEEAIGVEFFHISTDGNEGYPGNLSVTTTYWLTHNNELKIAFHATTDQPTAITLTNHTYWNLAGDGTILNHDLQIMADRYLETDTQHLPTGNICAVADTQYDFRELQRIGARMKNNFGYDNYYILSGGELAARVSDTLSGRSLEVQTTQPGLQFYSGNYLGHDKISNQRQLQRWAGLCLETQGYPDAVNHLHFPAIILLPNDVYAHETIYRVCQPGQ